MCLRVVHTNGRGGGGGGGGISTWPGMASSAADDLLHELCKHSDM